MRDCKRGQAFANEAVVAAVAMRGCPAPLSRDQFSNRIENMAKGLYNGRLE